jgi:DNA-binding beta-propeller fold protein YncE
MRRKMISNATRSMLYCTVVSLFGILGLILEGCGGSSQAEKDNSLVWPSAPDEPRIKYLKTLRGGDDYETGIGSLTRRLTGGSSTGLVSPFDICSDGNGHVWVTDAVQGVLLFDDVRKEVQLLGELSSTPLKDARGIAYGNNKVFVGVSSSGQVVVLTPEGKSLYTIGNKGRFPNPVDVVCDSTRQRILIVDNRLHNVSVFSEKGDSLFTIGRRGTEDSCFNYPQSAAVDNLGNIYVVDAFNFRIEVFDSSGRYLRKFGQQGDRWGMFGRPKGIALDSHRNIYVSDAFFHNFQIFNQQAELLLFVGKFSFGNDGFQDPVSLAIDAKNTLYVTDQLNKRVQVFQLLKGD